MKLTDYLRIILLVTVAGLIPLKEMSAQNDSLHVEVGLRTTANLAGMDQELPFWLHANRYGRMHQYSANALSYAAFDYPLAVQTSSFSADLGGELILRGADYSTLFVHQLYADFLFWDYFRLTAGRFPDLVGLNKHSLSSGSFMVSRNAAPMPKITFQTNGFKPVPYTQGYVDYNAYFSHGWLENGRFVDDVYLHQKYFYIKVNYWRLEGMGGIIHNVQWGGNSPVFGKLPQSLDTFARVVLGLGAKEGAPSSEQNNTLGNSVAAYDFALDVDLDAYHLRLYRIFYLEDRVSTRFRSPWDGMWGAYLDFPDQHWVSRIAYEHINTKQQDSFDFEPRGTASYYNHHIYKTGWTYHNRVLGNPLLLVDPQNEENPIRNNIIVAHHFGIEATLTNDIDLKFFYTFSRNYGFWEDQIIKDWDFERPIRATLKPISELQKNNHSFYLEAGWRLSSKENLKLTLELALDAGELYEESPQTGVGLGIRYGFRRDPTGWRRY